MNELATCLRYAQLTSHNLHNLVKGPMFLEYHEFFGEAYPAYEGDYDDVVERMIGLGQMPDLTEINKAAFNKVLANDAASMNAEQMFGLLLSIEGDIQRDAARFNEGASLGTQNLLQGIADKSEMRVYKIKQILKKSNGGSPIGDLLKPSRF